MVEVGAAFQFACLPVRHRQKCMEDQVLGEDVAIEIFPVDETNTRVRPDDIARQIQDNGGFGMVGFVGVQSNQFPRAMDCART